MNDVAVIGAGIFGCTIARALMAAGRTVEVFDDAQELAGSKASGCLMKPSWFAGMGKDVHEPSLTLLDELFGVRTLEFAIHGVKILKAEVLWVPRWEVLSKEGLNVRKRKISGIVRNAGGGGILYLDGDPEEHLGLEFKLIIVAAGYWTDKIMGIGKVSMVGKQGVSYLGRGAVPNVINPWAPYKQIVSFNETEDSFWIGDGTAILAQNWTAQRQAKSHDRAQKVAKRQPITAILGIRPYVKGAKPCLLDEVHPGLWVATGGAKNGLVAAGWCASEIVAKSC